MAGGGGGGAARDVFTDVIYLLVARDTTWFAQATLAPTSLANMLLGVYLLRAYRSRLHHDAERAGQ